MTPTPDPVENQAAKHAHALAPGTCLNDFEILGLHGEGGFSLVYVAVDRSLHRRVALKEYMPSAFAVRGADQSVSVLSESHRQTFSAGLRSFVDEARLLAQFDHPALVKVHRFWEAMGTAYMVMPFYDGVTLKKHFQAHPADEASLKALFAPVLDALELLHEHQCIHRDVSPDNILVLSSSGQPVLLDLGAARHVITDMTQAFTAILKPGYAPIEQYADDASMKQGPWTDVYAVAAVLHFAIAGKAPPASITRVLQDRLKPLRETTSGYSEEFLAGVDRGLAVHPTDRPRSIAEFRALLGIDRERRTERSHAPADIALAAGSVAADMPAGPTTGSPRSARSGVSGEVRTRAANTAANEAEATIVASAPAASFTRALPSPFQGPPTPELLAKLEHDLARFIGPMARIVVKRAAGQAKDGKELVRMLADELNDEADRQLFLKLVRSPGGVTEVRKPGASGAKLSIGYVAGLVVVVLLAIAALVIALRQ